MGAFEEAKGKAKEAAGEIIDDPDLQREGEAQKEKGEAQREEQEAHTKAKAEEMEQDAAEESK